MNPTEFELKRVDASTWLWVYLQNVIASFKRWKFFVPNVVLSIIRLLSKITIFYFMARFVGENAAPFMQSYGSSYSAYIVLGVIFESFLETSLSCWYWAYGEGYWSSKVEMFLVSPLGISAYLMGFVTFQYLWAGLEVAMYVLIGALLFGISLAAANYLTAIIVLIAGMLAITGLGLIAASTFTLLNSKNWSDPISWLVRLLAGLLCGVYFPIEVLPGWLQSLGRILPHTYAYRAARMAMLNGVTLADPVVAADIKALIWMATILLPLGIFMFAKSLLKAEVTGDLSRWS